MPETPCRTNNGETIIYRTHLTFILIGKDPILGWLVMHRGSGSISLHRCGVRATRCVEMRWNGANGQTKRETRRSTRRSKLLRVSSEKSMRSRRGNALLVFVLLTSRARQRVSTARASWVVSGSLDQCCAFPPKNVDFFCPSWGH